MKRLFTLLILCASLCASAVGASVANLANGYYRISNDFTNRYIQVVDNTGSLNYQASTADMGAIRLLLGLENVISDPASVLYLEKQTNGKYDIKAQNTGIFDIIKSHVNIIQNGSTYWAYGAQSGIVLYLWDALGASGNTTKAESGLQTSESKKYPRARDWNIAPIDNSTDNYFGITPTVTSQGKYYQPFYASFPFSCASEGMRVLYVTKIDEAKGELLYREIKGIVPALTPVIIECSSLNPADNKLNIGGKADPITDNTLKGVLFDSHIKKHENFVKYDATTMRVLGNTAGGNLGGVVANLTDVPRNTIYVPVSKSAPAEFVLVDASNMPVDVESISLNETSATINVGETLALSATVLPENATNKTVTWKSSDESVVKVDATGKVNAIKAGKATITASCGSVSATCEVTVVVPVIAAESITLSETTAAIKVGETLTLKATVLPENTTDKTVTWTSSDASVAKVDANGKVTAVSVGNATITATCGSVTATCAVTVEAVPVIAAESITLSENTADMKVGETLTLKATVLPETTTDKTVTWTTSDASVATVDNKGKVTAVAAGNATITASCGAITATCSVTVSEIPVVPAESITLSENTADMKVGETLLLKATVLPENANDKTVIWTSSDETVARVSSFGRVTAVAAGNATITASCGDITAICAVTVEEESVIIPAQFIALSMNYAEMKTGETLMLIPTVLPENTTDKTVVWNSNDETIATVDADGKVSAIASGNATITAACGAVTATCVIVVKDDDPVGEDKEFVGTIDMDMFGDETTLDNQKLVIRDYKTDECTIALYHFSMGDGNDLGDIVIENVSMSEADGVITYKGSKKGLSLAGGAITADVECEGTENSEGIIYIDINVLVYSGETPVPVKVTFTNDVSGIFDITVEDAPAEYYHINGVKATGLTPGLYIKVQGGKATKVLVK